MSVVTFTDKDDTLILDHPNRLLTDDNVNEIKSVINTNANAVSAVDNTSDADKPVSTDQAAAIAVVQNDINAHEANTSNPHGVTKAQVGLSDATNTADADKPVSTAQAAAIAVVQNDVDTHEALTNNPHSVTKAQVGLSAATNTSDADKPVSTAQQTALDAKQATLVSATNIKTINGGSVLGSGDIIINEGGTIDATPADGSANAVASNGVFDALALKAPIASPTFTGTVAGITKTMVGLGNVDNTSDASKPVSTANQTALDLKAPIASPTFTGTVSGITKTMVGLGNVDNTADSAKPVSTAIQTALDLKAPIASPTFTGTVAGITKTMVGLGNVDNTADTAKPVSTAQQTALDLKANLASPTFTGIVTTPALKITGGTPGAGKVWTSDADGDGTWEDPAAGIIDATPADGSGNAVASNGVFDALSLKQPLDSDLTFISGLSPLNDDFLQKKAGQWTNRTIAQVQTDLSVTLLTSFVDSEVPAGTVNSSNVTFTLANTPVAGSVKLYQNGIRLKLTADYTISGLTITFVTAPTTGDLLLADYRK